MKELLKVADISKSFYIRQEKQILKNVNMSLFEGIATGLLGETGSGKTTLARLIVGLETPNRGEILFKNKKMPNLRRRKFSDCVDIQYIFQDPYSALESEATVEEVLIEPLKLCKKYNFSSVLTPDKALEVVGIKNYSQWYHRRVHTLSGGQRQKICIARAIIPRPRLLIADESTSMLDDESSDEILEIIGKIKKQFNMALLIITHQLKIIERICDRIYILHNGEIIEQGKAETVLNFPEEVYTKQLLECMNLFRGVKNE
ncbi:ABC transporter ATP-binding protein [Natronincola ferrireducens]|uniref:Dipeptide transport system ATP-binding protein n=1 Tax=Natronincola ferrireducens TaxID=393762 RepID=A0A1G9GLN8_9FIRM|nr:ATP-binding cassette domain-containing protein [Natronincola ferrireducens]SDL01589.1 dipeptide transport system ATP-binding protein [Natronincola ferrireducens]